MPHGLVPWNRLALDATVEPAGIRCHGLVPWSLTLTATQRPFSNSTFLCDGIGVARKWGWGQFRLGSDDRKLPPGKPVALVPWNWPASDATGKRPVDSMQGALFHNFELYGIFGPSFKDDKSVQE
jgi:hypothetical protein